MLSAVVAKGTEGVVKVEEVKAAVATGEAAMAVAT